jgi:hypothetical protein
MSSGASISSRELPAGQRVLEHAAAQKSSTTAPQAMGAIASARRESSASAASCTQVPRRPRRLFA